MGFSLHILLFTAYIYVYCQNNIADPSYIGCYNDNSPERDLNIDKTLGYDNSKMTPLVCAQRCFGYLYYGIQIGKECRCGNTYGGVGKALETDCSDKCVGDTSIFCGGTSLNSIWNNYWYETGVGTPLSNHVFFDRIGVNCPANSVGTGLAFRRAGYGKDYFYIDNIVQIPPGGCCFFSDIQNGGTSFCTSVNVFILSEMGFNDIISSWKCDSGVSAILYIDVEYKGQNYTTSCADETLNLAQGYDDAFSSLKIVPCGDGWEGLIARMNCLHWPPPNAIVSSLGTPYIHQPGVGTPLTYHYYFDRVGGVCPGVGDVLVGFNHTRGGCNGNSGWINDIHTPKCTMGENDSNEGLYTNLVCAPLPDNSYNGNTWRATGIGAPLSYHAYWERLGTVCLFGEVLQGFRYERGGCNSSQYWYDSVMDTVRCNIAYDYNEGLMIYGQCLDLNECNIFGCGSSMGNIKCNEPVTNQRTCTCTYGTGTSTLIYNQLFSGCTIGMTWYKSSSSIIAWSGQISTNVATNLMDGLPSTFWDSDSTIESAWVIYFDSVHITHCFSAFKLQLTGNTSRDVKNFDIAYSQTSIGPWNIVYYDTAYTGVSNEQIYMFNATYCAPYWKFDILSTTEGQSSWVSEIAFGEIKPIFYATFDDSSNTIDLISETQIRITSRVAGLVGTYAINITSSLNQVYDTTPGIPWISPATVSGLSLEILFKPSSDFFSSPSVQSDFFQQKTSTGMNLLFGLLNASSIIFGLNWGGFYSTVQTQSIMGIISDGKMHHFVATYDSSFTTNNVKIYLDGVLVAFFTRSGQVSMSPTTSLYIGCSDLSTEISKGIIDEPAIYDYVLSDTDVLDHWYRVNKQCREGINWCGNNTSCVGVNYFTWSCVCNIGFNSSNPRIGCTEIDCCLVYGCGNIPGTTCTQKAINTRNCTCPSGYTGSAVLTGNTAFSPGCIDIQECTLYGCGHSFNGISCTENAPNQRTCTCPLGSVVNETKNQSITLIGSDPFIGCADLDECTNDTSVCGNSACFNAPPPTRWTCGCPPGFLGTIDGENATLNCNEIDECTYYGCNTQYGIANCTEGVNMRICTCPPLYSGTITLLGPSFFDGCFAICGDSNVVPPETCDDGNIINKDGCDSTCNIENGWTCNITVCKSICGDSIIVGSETCDDGNNINNDGCSSTCQNIPGWNCFVPGYQCSEICGDGLVVGTEQCDDFNAQSSDGCSLLCHIETGWNCGNEECTALAEICGDGIVVGIEQCDDKNTNSSDGCSSSCTIETGYICFTAGQMCTDNCGDGIVVGMEQCDDGTPTIFGDGCFFCTIEKGWNCSDNICKEICGDGIVIGKEQCDDGNINNTDGCNMDCMIENGWLCFSGDIPCIEDCGDHELVGNEQCDDGNTLNHDGCSSICTLEVGWTCVFPNPCTTLCGDGILITGKEICDDGNNKSEDGCTYNCSAVEVGWYCNFPGFACTPICGDGIITGGEECDDNNTLTDDGCTQYCTLQGGWNCSTPGKLCNPRCGDARIQLRYGNPSEECDDGNIVSNDGCSSDCNIEDGFICLIIGEKCTCNYTIWSSWTSCVSCAENGFRNRTRQQAITYGIPNPICSDTVEISDLNCVFPCPSSSQQAGVAAKDLFVAFTNSFFISALGLDAINMVTETNNGVLLSTSCNSSLSNNSITTNKLMNITEGILVDIPPSRISVTEYNNNNGECNYALTVSDINVPNNAILLLEILLPILLGCLFIVLVIGFFVYRKLRKQDFKTLPPQVIWQYDQYYNNSSSWENIDSFYRKKLDRESEDFKKFENLFYNHLGGAKLKTRMVYAVYNPNIVSNFANFYNILKLRFVNSPTEFKKDSWRTTKERKLRELVFDKYISIAKQYEWNQDAIVDIIPTIHGTSASIAQKICSTGFAALQSLDTGFYGKGIYFTTDALYALPYYCTKKKPAVLVSWVIPGNIYPTVESYKDSSCSLIGTALKAGYNCHFVCTRTNGTPIIKPVENIYNELVIDQEAQVCPVYVILINEKSMNEYNKYWIREASGINTLSEI